MRSNSQAAEAKAVKGRVIIRLPRNWFDNKQRSFSLQLPATAENLAHGVQVAAQINSDYSLKQFDRTLAKYKPQQTAPTYDSYSVRELWAKYCEYKSTKWKAKTKHYYLVTLGRHIEVMPQDWQQPLEIRSWLLVKVASGVAVRILNGLQSCITWAIRMRLIADQRNPFQGMGADLANQQPITPANAFTVAEEQQVIQAFYDSEVYGHYAPFVAFLFYCGCRPSEAVGLQWEQIPSDCTSITFDRSVVRIAGKYHRNHLSKNNRARTFPSSDRLIELLITQKSKSLNRGAVFQDRTGEMVNYDNFSKRAWPSIVFPLINRPSTPYCARDTFITRQIANGKPPVVIAKWVDNSVAMIERKYLDIGAIRTIRPD